MESIEIDYLPPWWLRNRHIQTCFMALFPPKSKQILRWEQLTLPDGDFIDICWAGPVTANVAVLLHGLEGGVKSHYIQIMIDDLVNAGWQVAVMHFRTCSGRLNLLPQSYHASQTQDIAYFLSVIKERFPERQVMAIGFSLGGNVLLHYLTQAQEFALLDHAVALSVPFDLHECAKILGKFYQWQFLRTMKQKVKDKIRLQHEMPVTEKELKLVKDFFDFDDAVTAPLHGFRSSVDYYDKSTVRRHLKNIKKPTMILHACDDPLVPRHAVPELNELSSSTQLILTEHGGHLGFLTARLPWQLDCWWRDRMLQFISEL